MRQTTVAQPLRQPLPGLRPEPPGRVEYVLVRGRRDAQQRLGQVDRGGRAGEPVEPLKHRDPLHEDGGVQRSGGIGRHGQQERLGAGLDDVDRLDQPRPQQPCGRGGAVRAGVGGEEAVQPRLVTPQRRGHVVDPGLGAVGAAAGFLAHDRLQRLGQRLPVAVRVADQAVQDPLEPHHVLVVRDDRREFLGDLDGRLDGARHRARLGHGEQQVDVRGGELASDMAGGLAGEVVGGLVGEVVRGGTEEVGGPGRETEADPCGGRAQLRQYGVARGLEMPGDHVEGALLEVEVPVVEGDGRVEHGAGGARGVTAGRTVEPGELGPDQFLLRTQQDPFAHLGEHVRLQQPGLVQADQDLLAVAGHRRRQV